MTAQKHEHQQGIGLIEVLITASIISLALVALAGVGNFALKIQHQLRQNTIASFLASEALEAARAVKDGEWSLLAALPHDTPLHPIQAPSLFQWTFADGAETIDNFTRQVTVSDVYRDGAFNIISGTGTLDPNTKKITATVSWNDNGQAKQISLTDYLMNWKP